VLYFYNEAELKEYQRTNRLSGGVLQRFKGLGEMDALHLRETTMSPEKGRFFKVCIGDIQQTYAVTNALMGIESKQRKSYLEKGEYKNASLVVENEQVELHETLLTKFLTYAYEVVEDRALPKEDGLKPVQRRILYTCYQLNLTPNNAHRKSSKIVGDVTGDYHPHGGESVYLAMVKMAQDFNYRYPLINGQGN